MKYNCSNIIEAEKLRRATDKAIENKNVVEFKRIIQNRSTRQNSALHLYYTFIAQELNDLGIAYQYTGISGNTFELKYTDSLVKEFIWRPIQIAMFDIKSTRKINTFQINDIIDVITNFFAGQGVVLEFPSIETLINQ